MYKILNQNLNHQYGLLKYDPKTKCLVEILLIYKMCTKIKNYYLNLFDTNSYNNFIFYPKKSL